jgi:hypothetical protein
MADGPFVKVYHVDLEANFPEIYRDARLLGTLVQLLAVADAMWPKLPEVPRSVRSADVKALEKAGLLTPIPPYHYSIRGLDAERTRRADAARNAAGKRWADAARNAAGSTASIPNRGRDSIKPESETEAEADHAAGHRTNGQPPIEEPLRIWLDGHGAHLDEDSSPRLNADLIQLAERDGTDVVLAAFERLARNSANRTPAQFIYGADRAIHPIESARSVPAETPDERQLREMLERKEARERARDTGATA